MSNWKKTKFAFASRSLVFADQMNEVIEKTKKALIDSDEVGEVIEEVLTAGGGGIFWYMKYIPKSEMLEGLEEHIEDALAPEPKTKKKK